MFVLVKSWCYFWCALFKLGVALLTVCVYFVSAYFDQDENKDPDEQGDAPNETVSADDEAIAPLARINMFSQSDNVYNRWVFVS